MKRSGLFRRMLDPLGGDIIDHPDRRLRVNLRRVERVAILAVGTMVMEAVFSVYRDIGIMFVLSILIAAAAVMFLFVARREQQRDIPALRYLPEFFIVYMLLSSQALGYFIVQKGLIAMGYALVFLGCSVFFLIPPKRFALIGIVTLAIFTTWILASPNSFFFKLNSLLNTYLAVGTAIFGRWSLDQREQVDARQKQQIARQNDTLVETNRKLLAHNAELNSLMAIAAHDLRSPLYGLSNLIHLAAARPPQSQSGWRELLHETGSSVTAMLALIGRLLEAHEAETQAGHDLEYRDLRRVLETAARRARPTAVRGGVTLEVESSPRMVKTRVDPDAVDQIVDNLISNAIRFSPPGSTVLLTAGIDRHPFLEVADQGVGVPHEERHRLFGKFTRGVARPINGSRGSGLGLYIVRTLATAMGATSSYRPAEQGGSVFRVEFEAGEDDSAAGLQNMAATKMMERSPRPLGKGEKTV